MRGALFALNLLSDEDLVTPYYLTFSELPDGVLLTPAVAFEHFKAARKRYKIRGKVFVLRLENEWFLIGRVTVKERIGVTGRTKTSKIFKIYYLGEENGSLESVVGKDGNDPE